MQALLLHQLPPQFGSNLLSSIDDPGSPGRSQPTRAARPSSLLSVPAQRQRAQTLAAPPPPHYVEVGDQAAITAVNNIGEGVGEIYGGSFGWQMNNSNFYWRQGTADRPELVERNLWPAGSHIKAINDRSVVAGSLVGAPNPWIDWPTQSGDLPSALVGFAAFFWERRNGLTRIDPPGIPSYALGGSGAFSINQSGVMAGWVSDSCDSATFWFPRCPGEAGALFVGGSVNNRQSIAPRTASCGDLSRYPWQLRTYLATSQLVGVNNVGHSAGASTVLVDPLQCGVATHAWAPENGGDLHPSAALPGEELSVALDINDHDQVVGYVGYPVHAILWDHGAARRLDDAGGLSIATHINNNGYVIGYIWPKSAYHPGYFGPLGVAWTPDGSLVHLGDQSELWASPAGRAMPFAINDQNRVAGGSFRWGFLTPTYWDFRSPIVVTVTVTPDTVLPVAAHCFDAITQTIFQNSPRCSSDVVAVTSRTDVIQLQVAAVYENGAPVSGATVEGTARAEVGSGGHQHGDAATRPVGTFFTAREDPNTAAGSSPGITGTSAADGTVSFQYRSSGVSGVEDFQVKVRLPGGISGEGTARLTVGVPRLIEIPRSATDFVVAGVTTGHPQNNFGTQELSDAAGACFADYKSDMDDLSLSYFVGTPATQFVITEVGLPSGGMLDLDEDWNAPHQTHRFGRQLDLRSRNPVSGAFFDGTRQSVLRDDCLAAGLNLSVEGNHYHLSLGAP